VQVLLSMSAQRSTFEFRRKLPNRVRNSQRHSPRSRLTLSLTAYLFSRLTHGHPFTVHACPRLTNANGNCEATTDSKRRPLCARPWINEMESRKWHMLRATRDQQFYSWSRIITSSGTRFMKARRSHLCIVDIMYIVESAWCYCHGNH